MAKVCLETWQAFPLRLVTAAWCTTLGEVVTLAKVQAALLAVPPQHQDHGELVRVSTSEGLREALKDLDTHYQEAVKRGIHRQQASSDRRSAFALAFRTSYERLLAELAGEAPPPDSAPASSSSAPLPAAAALADPSPRGQAQVHWVEKEHLEWDQACGPSKKQGQTEEIG